MRRDKTAARIILILSVVHSAIAAPAIVRQSPLDVDKDVTRTSEKRGSSVGDTASQNLYPVPQMNNELPTTSGTQPSHDDPPPESGTAQLHNDQPQTSLSQGDTLPASEDPQFHNDPAGSKDPQLHDASSSWWQHSSWRPTGEIEQGESSAQVKSESPKAYSLNSAGSIHYEGATWPIDFPVGDGTPSWKHISKESSLMSDTVTPPSSPLEPPPRPNALTKNYKLIAGFGAIAVAVVGVSAGLAYGLYRDKQSKDHSHAAIPVDKDLTSDVVSRGLSTHLQPPQKPVSRALANLKNEHSRLLSVLTRRALERLD